MRNLAPSIRASLQAKILRLLDRPLIARLVLPAEQPATTPEVDSDTSLATVFLALERSVRAVEPGMRSADPWRKDSNDGTFVARIAIGYDDLWRGCEKEVLDTFGGTIEDNVVFLTDEQRVLLERAPNEFMALETRPECAELVQFETENVGGGVRVVEIRVAAPPESRRTVRHVAIVPNLVQLERQLAGLNAVEAAAEDGPLAGLRALVGLSVAPGRLEPDEAGVVVPCAAPVVGRHLDEFQSACVESALRTPHFAVIQGPPGSGKTTVITTILQRALGRGERVLVVSPTHVAVDNVVEKLAPSPNTKDDDLALHTIPVRYSARQKKLSPRALAYWVGRKKQLRGTELATRLQRRLAATSAFAAAMFEHEDKELAGHAPLTSAVADVQQVICGTPIGILSYEPVKMAGCAAFDLLVVDEVSKMTLPEFLAIAVKAKRWVLVGDPEQLPPFNNAEENGTTLDEVFEPMMEVVCSVGAVLDRVPAERRRDERLVVVSSDPDRVASAMRAHLESVAPGVNPPVSVFSPGVRSGVVVCTPADHEAACAALAQFRDRDLTRNPDQNGSLRILVERGLRVPRPAFASGRRLLDASWRAQACIFTTCHNVYHAQPWSRRSHQRLRLMKFRNGLASCLPSEAAIVQLGAPGGVVASPSTVRAALVEIVAERFAVNTVSVYDWLTGMASPAFDTAPLDGLSVFCPEALRSAVRPYVGALKKQYRMHASLSAVPRELFYFGEALHDGRAASDAGCRVGLMRVAGDAVPGESNRNEVEAIGRVLVGLAVESGGRDQRPNIMIITPYRKQEQLLNTEIDNLRAGGWIASIDVEVCTLDRCQGREAEYVLISLVRSRATPFLDMPKRWNVALTRAMQGLFLVGDIDAYLNEASSARRAARTSGDAPGRPVMSLLARIIEAYASQLEVNHRECA